MANDNNKGTWKKGDVQFTKIVYKGKVYKTTEDLRKAKEAEKKNAKK